MNLKRRATPAFAEAPIADLAEIAWQLDVKRVPIRWDKRLLATVSRLRGDREAEGTDTSRFLMVARLRQSLLFARAYPTIAVGLTGAWAAWYVPA